MASIADPVELGLVASLAQPGGNVTGMYGLTVELNTKRLEVLKDAVPKLARVGLLRRPASVHNPGEELQLKEIRPSALALKLKLEDRDSTRSQRFRERFSNRKAEAGPSDHDNRHTHLFRRKKTVSRTCNQIPVYLLFTQIRSMCMRAASCFMGWTPTTNTVRPPTTLTRF